MPVDLIVHNAKIYTVEPAQPWAEAVACAGGRIVAVGRNAEILALAGSATERIDAQGRLVLPGLIDAHVHFLQVAIRAQQVSLFGLRDFAAVRERLAASAAQLQPGEWLQGWGWDDTLWDVQPTAALLDKIVPRAPVILHRLDMHTVWVNSAALRAANISATTPAPVDSRIDRDAAGQLTGLLREWNAIKLVEQVIPRPTLAMLYPWLKEAITTAHRLGLTGIHDQRVEREGRQSFRLFQRLDRAGALKLRVHHNLAAAYVAEAAAVGLQAGFGSDRLWLGHVKAFADGTLGSRTALMLEPFTGSSDNTGLAVTSTKALVALAEQTRRAGLSLSIHAIGDRAVREGINVLTEFPPDLAAGQLPHRIEHVQVIHPDDIPRLGRSGLHASMQPYHLSLDWPAADKYWGPRTRTTYAFRSLLAAGTPLAFGSDAPVAPLDPLLGLYAAVTRQDAAGQPLGGWQPDERLTLAEAIHGYTLGPARLAGKADRQGSIAAGKWADLIMLDRNLFELEPAEIKEAKVELTVFDGQVVYRRAE